MRLKSNNKRSAIVNKICSVTLALAMVTGMMFVQAPVGAGTNVEVSAATTADGTVYYPEWQLTTAYVLGDLVSYEGKVYECIYAHTSNSAWIPGTVPTLWQERTDLTYVKPPEETTTETTTQGSGGDTPIISGKKTNTLLIGYYHTWHDAGNPFIKLRDVDKNWDVINISFAEPVSAGSTDGKMQLNIGGLTADYTKEDFKQDIKNLQAEGKKIVLSIGGYEGYFSLGSQAAVDQFVSDIKSFIDDYGFDGIDIDLEQSSVNFDAGNDTDIRTIKSPRLANMVSAIKTIVDSYGDDFILSWAPETFYVQMGYQYYAGINGAVDARAGSYLPMINALREETTFVHVQLYNSMAMTGLDGVSYTMGTKEGVVAMCEMLLKGFYVGSYYGGVKDETTYFAPLRPDQVVIGVPSSAGAAGSGQISNANLQAAFTELNNKYPGMRGIMTWSINWDSVQNNNSFARENQAFLAQFRPTEEDETTKPVEQPTEEITTKPVEQPTEEVTTKNVDDGIVVSDDVEINGFQISSTVEGFRTVYSVESRIDNKDVVNVGMVYSLSSYATEDELYVGSDNTYVRSFEGTSLGVSSCNFSDSATATSYAMTMKFSAKTAAEFTTGWRVRAYAKLSDGTYVYSNAAEYTINTVAELLYQNLKMNTFAAHNYLYTDILKVVNPNYVEKDFDWNNALVGLN